MKSLAKKVVAYTMVGLFSLGIGTGVIEASPRDHDNRGQQQKRYTQERRDDRQARRDVEVRRHEREMQRRNNENYHAWQERQRLENERHENAMKELGFAVLLTAIVSNINNQ